MFQLSQLAKIVDGKLHGEDLYVSSFTTNTRELTPGQLFIALKGEQFDGHDFLASACEKQAAAAIVSQDFPLAIPTIRVSDTKIALGRIAAFHRKQFDLPIIAVTGSCGKTTTKTMIASILNQMAPTLAPIKSYNNDVGVPLTLLQLNQQHRYAVIEMGANHPGEISYLSSITQQRVSVITNVAPAHLAGFETIEGIAKAKGEIYQILDKEGIAIINQDDQFVQYWKGLLTTRSILTFGMKESANIYAKNIVLTREGWPQFDVVLPDGGFTISLPLLGVHNVINALAAIACTFVVGASHEAMVQGLTQVSPVSKRLVKYPGLAGAMIIDDSYNANPLSVSAALDILAHIEGEKIFVFGDMAELGSQEDEFHREIGVKAKHLGINRLFAFGRLSELTVQAFGDAGSHFKDQASLIAMLKTHLHANATVLIKGSRSAKMENIVQAIIQEK